MSANEEQIASIQTSIYFCRCQINTNGRLLTTEATAMLQICCMHTSV